MCGVSDVCDVSDDCGVSDECVVSDGCCSNVESIVVEFNDGSGAAVWNCDNEDKVFVCSKVVAGNADIRCCDVKYIVDNSGKEFEVGIDALGIELVDDVVRYVENKGNVCGVSVKDDNIGGSCVVVGIAILVVLFTSCIAVAFD